MSAKAVCVWQFDAPVRAVAIAPSGDRMAVACADGTVRLEETRPQLERAPWTRRVRAMPIVVAFSDDERWLASGTEAGVEVFDLQRSSSRWVSGRCTALRFASDGWLLIGGPTGARGFSVHGAGVRHLLPTQGPVIAFAATCDRAFVAREETVWAEPDWDAHGEVAAPPRTEGTRSVLEAYALPRAATPRDDGWLAEDVLGAHGLAGHVVDGEAALAPTCALARDRSFYARAEGCELRRVDLSGEPGSGPRVVDRRSPALVVVAPASAPTSSRAASSTGKKRKNEKKDKESREDRKHASPPPLPAPKVAPELACTRCQGFGSYGELDRGVLVGGACSECDQTGLRSVQDARHASEVAARRLDDRCGACGGTGALGPTADPACLRCRGLGELPGEVREVWDSQGETAYVRDDVPCPCVGTPRCASCNGTGKRG